MKIEIDFDMGYETNIPWIEESEALLLGNSK